MSFFMTNSPDIFFQRLSQRVVVLLAVIMLPALLASGLRAFNADGAYGVFIFQVMIYAWIVYLALPLSRTSFAVRTYSLVTIGVAIGVGALIRNTEPGTGMPGTGMAFLIVASVFLSAINTGPARYIFIAVIFPVAAVISHFVAQLSWQVVISHALSMAGMAAVANMLVGGVVAHAKGRLQEELRLQQERDRALADLEREKARRDLVAGAADIAYLEYDYATGMLDGDLALKHRYGRDANDGAIELASRFDSFPSDSLALLQQKIGEMSLQPVGAEATFVHQQLIGAEPTLRTLRVTGLNVERDGRLFFMGASVDISDEMNALEKAEDLSGMIELISGAGGVGLIEFFPDTHTFKCNPEVSARLGLEHTELEREIALFYAHQTEETVAEFKAWREALHDPVIGSPQSFVHPFYLANGELHYMRVSRVKREVNGRVSFLGLSLDITEEVQAKEQAEKQADQLRLITEQGKIGLYEFDIEKGVMHANSVLCERYEVDPDVGVITQQRLMQGLTADSREAALEQIESGKTKPDGDFSTSLVDEAGGDGSVRKIRIFEKLERREGRPFYVGASVDVTEEVEAKERAELQAEQLNLLALSGDVAYFVVDLERGTIDGNALLKQRAGLSADAPAFPMTQIVSSIPEEARVEFEANVQRAIGAGLGGVITFEHPYYKHDGGLIYVRVTATTQMREGRLHALGASVEITEAVLAMQRAEDAKNVLAQQQDRQAQMYAVIGHELRTPAASLQMMLDDLGEGETLDSALARANIEQLLSVIDTLRAVAQPERMAQATYDDVQLDEMLQQQVQNFQTLAAGHGIQLKTDFTGLTVHPVHIRKTLLRQVLSNLIKNGLIHSGGTELEIGASGRLLEGQRKALRLWIADNGKGVSADKVERLFEAFVRGSTEAEGTGLGLHICRQIIQDMGGDLRYEPRPEGGACFVIELEVDLAKTDLEQPLKPQTDESPMKGMRVLVAEDNKTIQMLTQKMLEKQGAQVTVCNNGKEALEAFEPGSFDLVLSDIFMPEMNGYGLAREIRRVDTSVPLIGLTAATIGKETDEMQAAGATAVLSKPINLAKLIDVLNEITSSELSG